MYHKQIDYDRTTGDFAMYLDHEFIGYASTYHEAENVLNKLVFELMNRAFSENAG